MRVDRSGDGYGRVGASRQTPETIPIMVGFGEDMPACGGMASANGPVEVRSGPGEKYPVIGMIERGKLVHACAGALPWFGIIYPQGEWFDCGVNVPIVPERAYAGPCVAGWVHSSLMTWRAG